jgi:hypothetical protein
VSMLDYKLDRKKVRRLEVITGACRWHQFTEDFKAQVVEETLVPGPRLFLARACSWPALVPGPRLFLARACSWRRGFRHCAAGSRCSDGEC